MVAKNGRKNIFGKKVADDSVNTLGLKNFIEIALSHTISKINMFCTLHKIQGGCQN